MRIGMGSPQLHGNAVMERYDAAQIHLEHYGCETDARLDRIIMLDDAWTRSCEPKLTKASFQSMARFWITTPNTSSSYLPLM
ncbi:hypothetical protein Trydic_g20183 [Trypoxylus dichotomus]